MLPGGLRRCQAIGQKGTMTRVEPACAAVEAGGKVEFELVEYTAGPVRWSLEPAADAGVINPSNGTYSAPALVPKAVAVRVKASDASGTLLAEAEVQLTPPDLKVLPASVELKAGQPDHFTVEPKAYASEVTWTLEPSSAGTLSERGDYVAPKWVPFDQKALVVASWQKRHAHATVTLSSEGFKRGVLVGYWLVFIAGLSVSLFLLWPRICAVTREARSMRVVPALVTLKPGDQQQFQAWSSGTTNQTQAGVAWVASRGSISAGGLYVAPTNETAGGAIITATSLQDPRWSAHASVNLSTGVQFTVQPELITVSDGQTVQFNPSPRPVGDPPGSNAAAVIRWTLSPREAGSLTTNGFYQAPPSISASRLATVTAEFDKDPRVAAAALVQLSGPAPWCSRAMLLQLWLVLTLGALGSCIHAISSFVTFVGNRQFVPSWFLWYLFRPFQGAALALVIYLVVGAGLLKVESTGGLFGAAALAVMVGLFADQASQKLGDVAKALFGSPSETDRRNKLGSGAAPQTPAPQIASVSPPEIKSGQSPAPALTISGAHFATECAIRLNGMDRRCASTSPTELKLNLKTDDVAKPGTLLLVVVNADKQTSNEAKVTVT
jgi:hypothetical protein